MYYDIYIKNKNINITLFEKILLPMFKEKLNFELYRYYVVKLRYYKPYIKKCKALP